MHKSPPVSNHPNTQVSLFIGAFIINLLVSCCTSPHNETQIKDQPHQGQNPFELTDFVYIPAGSFMMGSDAPEAYPDEQPVHEVRLSQSFYMGATEVTQAQWMAVMGTNPSQFEGAQRPVDNVGMHDIEQFLDALNGLMDCSGCYRLPTEAEWEYAARAGSSTPYSFGSDVASLDLYAWFSGNANFTTHPVAQKQPNDWGLYDMHGNVYEWVQDRYGPYDTDVITDPTGPSTGEAFVLRGGSWTDDAREQRLTYRDYYAPDHRHNFFGFRLVRTDIP